MTDFLLYQGRTAIILAVFYMFYRLLLSKDTFHRFNRIVLLGTAALSFILPFCVITLRKVVVLPSMNAISITPADEVAETVAMVPETSEPIWTVVLCLLFALGALVILVNAIVSIIAIKRIINSGSRQVLESGETLIITETDTAPFSWMKYIVISREDYESGYSQILTHEKAHIALRHSWDILFVDMITALQWFNPAIWMLKADLRALHEFEADDAVLRSGADIKEYQYLLIRKAVSKSGYSVANSFNHSTLKARITMMLNKKSSRMSAWKALYVIPLVGISLAATAETKVDYQYEDQQPEAVADTLKARVVKVHGTHLGKDSKNSFKAKNRSEARLIADESNGSVTMIYYGLDGKEYKAEWSGLDLNENVYLVNGAIVTDKNLFDRETAGEEVVVLNTYLKNGKKVMAVVTPDREFVGGKASLNIRGNIVTYRNSQDIVVENIDKDVETVRMGNRGENDKDVDVDMNDIVIVVNGERMPADFDLNTISPDEIVSMEVLKNERALREYGTTQGVIKITVDPARKNEPEQIPDIYINGRKATGEELETLPSNPKGTISADGTRWITTEEVPDAELQNKAPSFNGGSNVDFQKWVNANIKYPEGTTSEGRVAVTFTVSETGKVMDVKALQGPDQKLNDEAVRVISSSPDWTPALKDGQPVAIKLTIPVMFQK